MSDLRIPSEARVVLVDGPVSIFIHEASEVKIFEAFRRLECLVLVAAEELGAAYEQQNKDSDAHPRSQR